MLITGVIFIRRRHRKLQQNQDDDESYEASFGMEGFPGTGEEEATRSDKRSSGSDWLSMLRFNRNQRQSRQSDFMREVFSE
jgi:hypothetical protein